MNKIYIDKIKNKQRKIIYWGIGHICQCCLQCHPEVEPLFFVDSYSTYKIYENRVVRYPEEVSNWLDYYVIISVKDEDAKIKIQNFLNKKGLTEGEDFWTYNKFFSCPDITFETSVYLAEKYMEEHPDALNLTLLQIPLEGVRNYKTYMNFMSGYIQERGENACVIMTCLQVMNEELAANKIKCPVIPMPNKGNGFKEGGCKFTKKEKDWLKELDDRKNFDGKEKLFYDLFSLYYYYKLIIETIKPSKIIIWGNWRSESYVLGHLSDIYNIPHAYMEYGWIPGTYQADPRGIAGQSEYAVNPYLFKDMEIENIYNINQIKRYVKNNKLDTRIFADTEEDNTALSRMDKERKTVFLVGMDERGMRINPQNVYWKKHISNVVESTKEALFLLIEVCKKNHWNLIFKPHPTNLVPELGECLTDIIIVKDTEIDRLIELSDVVVSIVSAVDYKVLIYGKPLVSLGITTLLGKGCAYIVLEQKMLEEQLLLALENGMTEEQTENFNRLLQIILQRYLWDDMSERSLRYGLTVEHDFL